MGMRDKRGFIPCVAARDETTDFLPRYSGMKAHFCGIHRAKAVMSGGVLVTVFLWSPPMVMVVNEEDAPPQFSVGLTVVPTWAFLTPEYPSSP